MSRSQKRKKEWSPVIKSYCVVQESKYLMIEHVAALNIEQDLQNLVEFYGDVEE
jgi:hypothetical protein